MSRHAELLVIGGGPGGYAAAFRAADLGVDVTLVDPEPNPGGVCLYRGCIPSKALLHVAETLHRARRATRWGVDFGAPNIDVARVRVWKDDVVHRLTRGLGALADRRGVRHLQGRARFVDADRVAVGDETLTFGRCIVATGSAPVRLPMLPDSPRVWDSAAALALDCIPANLLVIGGGYIGLEMATVYAALGADVTVVEATDGLLPGVDRALVQPLAEMLTDRGVDVRTGTTVEDAREDGDGLEVGVRGPDGAETLRAERALVAVGRAPLTDGLDLHRTRVEVGPDDFVRVDAQQRTTDRRILAIGDVAGGPMLAHKASHEGRVAAEVAAGRRAAFDARAIPAVVFTDPAIAWCGLTEAEAEAQGVAVEVAGFPWSASGRAVTLDRTEGVTRVILEAETRRVLGVGMVGVDAGELIAEAALAIEMGATADDLARTVHPHPTLSETLAEAAEQGLGGSPHRAPSRGG